MHAVRFYYLHKFRLTAVFNTFQLVVLKVLFKNQCLFFFIVTERLVKVANFFVQLQNIVYQLNKSVMEIMIVGVTKTSSIVVSHYS